MRLVQVLMAALIGGVLWVGMNVYGYYALFGMSVFKPLFSGWDNIRELLFTFIRGFLIVLFSVLIASKLFRKDDDHHHGCRLTDEGLFK